MPRYIDAEPLEDDFQEWYKLFAWDDGGVEKSILARAIHIIQDAPTIEPKRKTGKWIYDEERGATGIYAICSACDESIYQTGDFKFCPNCGADMRGNTDD